MQYFRLAISLVASSLFATSSAFTVTGTKWMMGPNLAIHLPGFEGTPGFVTWSIMGASLPIMGFETHMGDTTTDFGMLLGTSSLDEEIAVIEECFETWSAVSGIVAIGPVLDGGAPGGAPEFMGAHLGDIRFGAIGGFIAGGLAHAVGPGTEELFGVGGTIGGDLHVNDELTWVDDPDDPIGDTIYDLHTVVLHELGHSLGLGHSDVAGAVMAASYEGGKRSLTADDVEGISYIYGPVPEPSSLALLGIGTLALLRKTRKKK